MGSIFCYKSFLTIGKVEPTRKKVSVLGRASFSPETRPTDRPTYMLPMKYVCCFMFRFFPSPSPTAQSLFVLWRCLWHLTLAMVTYILTYVQNKCHLHERQPLTFFPWIYCFNSYYRVPFYLSALIDTLRLKFFSCLLFSNYNAM